MKRTYRMICLLLVLAMAAVLLAACGDKEESSASPSGEETSSETSGDQFPLEKQDFGGVTIKVLTDQATDYLKCEIAATESNTEPVNDASYNRANLIAQEYGINIEQVYAESQKNLMETARENITTNLDEYQIYCGAIYYLSSLAADGLFYDLGSIDSNDYIHLDADYWDQTISGDLSLLGSIYYATGDAVVSDDESTWCMFFNKDIATDAKVYEKFGAGSIYEVVDNHDWTLDTMYEMAKEATQNVSGSQPEFSVTTQDIFGMVAQCYDSYAMTAGCGQTLVVNDGETLRMSIGDESNIRAYEQVYEILKDRSYVGIAETDSPSDPYGTQLQIFSNGKALFMPNKVGTVSNATLRTAELHYGILPMPLLDKSQEKYTSTVTVYWCSALAIPISNVTNFDATCYAMEALAYYGKEMMTPEFYDRTLKNKRFEDTESEEMLDLIFRNRTYDMGAVFNFSGMLSFYTDILLSASNNHVSKFEANKGVYQLAIDNLIEQINEEKEKVR